MRQSIKTIRWRRCGVADIRALLGEGGGHNVVVFGPPDEFKKYVGVVVRSEKNGATSLPLQKEPGGATFELEAYLHEGRGYVHLKAPAIVDAGAQPSAIAKANEKAVRAGGTAAGSILVVFLITTHDGLHHLRASLLSDLQATVRGWVGKKPWGGRIFSGVTLGPWEQRVWTTLLEHKNVLLYGPPGTGKTWSMLQIRKAFEHGVDEISFDPTDLEQPFHQGVSGPDLPSDRRCEFVTFHQSLTYESFVVGLHPKPIKGKSGGLQFAPKDGVFLDLAEHALKPDSASLLLVDELNRGNVADIFGELITILEDDKRLDPDGKPGDTTVAVRLPLKPERLDQNFVMPSPFYLLASMNSLDRSVAPLDSALRRRFRLLQIVPDAEVAEDLLLQGEGRVELTNATNPSDLECKTLVLQLWEQLNKKIRAVLGVESMLGQSYLLKVRDYQSLVDALDGSIFPQLYELFRDRPQELFVMLGEDLVDRPADAGASGLGLLGNVPPEIKAVRDWKPAKLMKALYQAAKGEEWADPNAPAGAEEEESGTGD